MRLFVGMGGGTGGKVPGGEAELQGNQPLARKPVEVRHGGAGMHEFLYTLV